MRTLFRIRCGFYRVMHKIGYFISYVGLQIEKASRLRFGSRTFFYGIDVMQYWYNEDVKFVESFYRR